MALQKTVTTTQGFTTINAYFRVEGLSLVSKTKISFQICGYAKNSNVIIPANN